MANLQAALASSASFLTGWAARTFGQVLPRQHDPFPPGDVAVAAAEEVAPVHDGTRGGDLGFFAGQPSFGSSGRPPMPGQQVVEDALLRGGASAADLSDIAMDATPPFANAQPADASLPGRANLALAISDGDEVAMMDADAHVGQADAHVEQPRGYHGGSAASSAVESPAEHWLQAAPAPGDAVVPSPLAGAWHHL